MRTSILSRSVIAVATLAISSVALAATPATAATAQGVTRDEVLTAVNGARAAQLNEVPPSTATARALRAIIYKTCDVISDQDESASINRVQLMNAGDDAEGLLITARVNREFNDNDEYCIFAAVATTDTSSVLSGSATVEGTKETYVGGQWVGTPVIQTTALSGDAFTTPVISTLSDSYFYDGSASATGNATKSTPVVTTTKVVEPKSTSAKKAAKKTYDSQLKAAKKSYKKALAKAGSNKSKKKAAKKANSKKKASAKAAYTKAIASGTKTVSTTSYTTENRPFSITTDIPEQPQR